MRNRLNNYLSFFQTLIKSRFLYLLILCVISSVLVLRGSSWGLGDRWNPDEMAFQHLKIGGEAKYFPRPSDFRKPPFHTYFIYFLVELPFNQLSSILRWDYLTTIIIQRIAAKVVVAWLHAGSGILIYLILRKFTGEKIAKIFGLLFVSSAGLVSYAHFLTADTPVLFWMLVSLYFSVNVLFSKHVQTNNYIWGGFFAGIAGATKYNGLLVLLFLWGSHILSIPKNQFARPLGHVFNRNFWYCSIMSVMGFVLGNPYIVLDFSSFFHDFKYLVLIERFYVPPGPYGYGAAFMRMGEVFLGYPVLTVISILFFVTLFLAYQHKQYSIIKLVVLCVTMVLIYYSFFGANILYRFERFQIVLIPFLLFSAAYGLEQIFESHLFLNVLLAGGLFAYNLVSSVYVGDRFLHDPRMEACDYMVNHVVERNVVLSSSYSPKNCMLKNVLIKVEDLKLVDTQAQFFRAQYTHDRDMIQGISRFDGDASLDQYSYGYLKKKDPDFILLNSKDFGQFFENDLDSSYLKAADYIKSLLNGQLGYKTVFYRHTESVPKWTYPPQIGFLDDDIDMIIMQKN